MKKSNLLKLAIGLTIITGLSACAPVFEDVEKPEDSQPQVKNEKIVVGVILPLSGNAASYGTPSQYVLEIAKAKINEKGGIGGKQLELAFEDGGCETEKANSAVNNLINLKKVQVIVGGFCSSETLAGAPVAERNKVVLFSPGSSSPKITEAGDYIFRNYPSDNAQSGAIAEYANSQGFKNVGIITEEQPYSEGVADSFTKSFGGSVINEKYPVDSTDFKSQIDKLAAAKVDALFVNPQTPASAAIIVKQLKEKGVKVPLLFNDVAIGAINEVITPFSDYVEGAVGAEVPYNKDHAEFNELITAYKARTNEDIPYLSYMSPMYDTLFIIKEAIEKVGYDGTKIKDYLYTVQGRVGVAGTLSFDENGDPDKSYRHALKKIVDGKVVDAK